jgi:Protein of Unknown function (DUF2784).
VRPFAPCYGGGDVTWLLVLDVFFLAFHTLWVVFNMAGWAWRRTRRLHLVTMGLTAFSWFVIGPLWYGTLGYCLCTDWHWAVRRQLGYADRSQGYVHFLAHTLLGLDLSPRATDLLTGGVFGLAAVMTVALNFRDLRHRRSRAEALSGDT